jgi:hypothetical protein
MEVILTHHLQVITLDPLSPWGYEMKHVALHKAGDFDNAVDALETMLMKMSQLSDIEIRGECGAIMLKFISELASQRILVGM